MRVALETRLKNNALESGLDLQRLRTAVAFDRFLARVCPASQEQWALKGGYAMELQLTTARSTRDLDLTLPLPGGAPDSAMPNTVRHLLQQAVEPPLSDHFRFIVGEASQNVDGAPYGGARYPVEARMGGRTFARFHVDVGVGDIVLTPTQSVLSRDWMGFAGIPAPTIRLISKAQQFAEKIHAYSLPRAQANTRAKDLVDLTLLVRTEQIAPGDAWRAIDVTFRRRQTHEVPRQLPETVSGWRVPVETMLRECGVDVSLMEAFAQVHRFFDLCLAPEQRER